MASQLISRRQLAVAMAFARAPLPGQSDETSQAKATFHSSSNLVLLEVGVVDEAGLPVSGLTQDDFQVKESGRPRALAHFSSGTAQVSACAVVDFSQSMRPHRYTTAGALTALERLLDPNDEFSLIVFSDAVHVRYLPERLTVRPANAESPLAGQRPDGRTALYDALLKAIEVNRSAVNSRRVLILVSDGEDNASQAAYGDVLAAIEESNVILYAVGLFTPGSSRGGAGVLRRLTESTGGLVAFDPDSRRLLGFFERVIKDLRSRYVLGYMAAEPPSGVTETRRLEVQLTGPAKRLGLRVRTRRHYRIKGAAE